MRKVLDDALPVDAIVRPGRDQVERDDAFAAALPPLPAGFLERHVQPGERVEVASRPRVCLRRRERRLGVEVLRPHELLLAELAERLEVRGHARGL